MECRTMLTLRMLQNVIRKRIESSQVKKELDAAAGTNGWVLGYLAEHEREDVYQRDLEKVLFISRSAISKIVAALEKEGLLERGRVASDDRLKKLILTNRGRMYTEQIRADNRKIEAQLTKGFTDEDLLRLHAYLQRMQQNLEEN